MPPTRDRHGCIKVATNSSWARQICRIALYVDLAVPDEISVGSQRNLLARLPENVCRIAAYIFTQHLQLLKNRGGHHRQEIGEQAS